ncbi:NAD-dependent epimerase/dehydratase family protein [Maribacter stanieri]|uniref:NAD-dependent epimerase/dehydratase family protein n=1 Tax=Maribacter stanieri TaxID=440514 RepID=UPI0024954B52|nr:NAD(P)-dependent oxidoreductase [Maribacter stanieri]
MASILITGAFGVLGSELVKKIISEGQHKVIALVKSTSDPSRLIDKLEQIRVYHSDKDQLSSIFKNEIQHIIHTATVYGRNLSKADTVKNNVDFPLELIELAIKNNVKTFLNSDSYFNKFNMYSYLNEYVVSKNKLEKQLKKYDGIRIFNLKIEHIYTGNDTDRKFVNKIINQIVSRESKIELTKGNQKRDFIFISDVVDFYLSIINNANSFEKQFYNFEVGTGNSVSIKDFVLLTMEVFENNETILEFGAIPQRKNEIMESKADLSKTPKHLKWTPKIDLRTGLKLIKKEWKNSQ